MAEISVNGIRMDIPDGITTETLLQRSHGEEGDIAYRIDFQGNQQVLTPGQEVEVEEGDRFGTISRFRTGGSEAGASNCMQVTCRFLEGRYGASAEFAGERFRQLVRYQLFARRA